MLHIDAKAHCSLIALFVSSIVHQFHALLLLIVVCDQLGVPLETVSLQKEYWRDVVQYTLQEAKRGRTPNPDIMCNSRVKFGTFYDYVGR